MVTKLENSGVQTNRIQFQNDLFLCVREGPEKRRPWTATFLQAVVSVDISVCVCVWRLLYVPKSTSIFWVHRYQLYNVLYNYWHLTCFSFPFLISENSGGEACSRFSFLVLVTKHWALLWRVKGRDGFCLKGSDDWRIFFLSQEGQSKSRPVPTTQHRSKMFWGGKH